MMDDDVKLTLQPSILWSFQNFCVWWQHHAVVHITKPKSHV